MAEGEVLVLVVTRSPVAEGEVVVLVVDAQPEGARGAAAASHFAGYNLTPLQRQGRRVAQLGMPPAGSEEGRLTCS